MAIKRRYCGLVFKGTLAEFTATTRPFPLGALLLPTDSDEARFSNGTDVFEDLVSMPAQALQKSDYVAPLGATTNMTAVGAVFADLTAARTAVNTLRTDAEARLDAIEAKVDALIAALIAADLMDAA